MHGAGKVEDDLFGGRDSTFPLAHLQFSFSTLFALHLSWGKATEVQNVKPHLFWPFWICICFRPNVHLICKNLPAQGKLRWKLTPFNMGWGCSWLRSERRWQPCIAGWGPWCRRSHHYCDFWGFSLLAVKFWQKHFNWYHTWYQPSKNLDGKIDVINSDQKKKKMY